MTQDEIIEMARQAGSIDYEDVILTVYNAFASAEREACAKVCEPQEAHDDPLTAWKIAQAIRARGEA